MGATQMPTLAPSPSPTLMAMGGQPASRGPSPPRGVQTVPMPPPRPRQLPLSPGGVGPLPPTGTPSVGVATLQSPKGLTAPGSARGGGGAAAAAPAPTLFPGCGSGP